MPPALGKDGGASAVGRGRPRPLLPLRRSFFILKFPGECLSCGANALGSGGRREVKALAVSMIPLDSRLQVRYQTGVNGEGEPVYSTRNLGSVRADSDDQSLWTVAAAITGLQQLPVAEVRRIDYGVLTETP